jgi:autotransporter adhesin
MANIPQVDQNKTFAVGVGLGNFQSQTALALGVSYRVAPNAVIKASASTTNADRKTTVYGVGAGFSW